MSELFKVGTGSVPGREHIAREGLLIGRNNQDAFSVVDTDNTVLVVVADGCGSSPSSEIGAAIGCRLLVRLLMARLKWLRHKVSSDFFEDLLTDFLSELESSARGLTVNGSLTRTITETFLFTVIGCVVGFERSWVFWLGDGYYGVNGQLTRIGPFPGNRPPYAAYRLINTDYPDPIMFGFQDYPTSEVESIMIATDGLEDLISAEDRHIPGCDMKVGNVSQFWTDPRYVDNMDAIRRRLALINSSVTKRSESGELVVANGLLSDDTTISVLRRRE